MKIAKYFYNGPPQILRLKQGEDVKEISLFPNKEYSLPEENSIVQGLVALKMLKVETPEQKAARIEKEKEADTKESIDVIRQANQKIKQAMEGGK